jgi:hypothetical protein
MNVVYLAPIVLVYFAAAAEHPGNVFLQGENVRIAVPAAWSGWRAVDVEGKLVGQGTAANGMAEIGSLPTGYYEVRDKSGAQRVTAAVLTKTQTSDDTPIAIDAAISWFYSDPEQIRGACKLCRLAGVKWVRDRASWPEIEPARGTWAGDTRYEKAMRIEHDEGLKILQVNHIAPPWASKDPTHFPDDLRDVYDFYRGLAKRWKGLADVIEPWNEPDIDMFGGHTGCEIASFQKAAYLGLKAGNPDLPVCQAVFAIDRAQTLDEFGANEVYPYFDRYDLHHYIKLADYPRAYARHRAVSGGRPLWTTEFNLNIFWSDEKTKELSDDDLRVQAYRIPKAFVEALHEGTQKAFYFMLGHYVERNVVYGIVHPDLTPRPAYVTFAAVGRLLNAATPLGRVNFGDDKLKGYVFKTKVDGANRETLVAWSETKNTSVRVTGAEKMYDYLGRKLEQGNSIELTRAPIFVVLPRGGSKNLKIEAPPANAKWQSGSPCPVVLQLTGKGDVNQSAFVASPRSELRLRAYNFGTSPVRGKLSFTGIRSGPSDLEIAPSERYERTIAASEARSVTARFETEGAGSAIVFARLVAEKKESAGK